MAYTMLKRKYWLRTRGYWAHTHARDDVRYEELHGSLVEHVDIPGVVNSPGPGVSSPWGRLRIPSGLDAAGGAPGADLTHRLAASGG